MVTHPSDFCGTSGGSNLFVVFGVAHIFSSLKIFSATNLTSPFSGYWGDGATCSSCKFCDENADTSNTCSAGSTEDTTACSCKNGARGGE